jgi:hypothetical protein
MSGVISRHDLGACPVQDGTCEIVGITNAFIDHRKDQWLSHWMACRAHEKIGSLGITVGYPNILCCQCAKAS